MNNKLGLFSFIKDEINFISNFIEYHKKIFDEITIIDNGSTDGTLEILKEYNKQNIINLIEDHSKFSEKGNICTKIMKNSLCDLLIPIDADEKIIFDNSIDISNDPIKIKNYLKSVNITGFKYKINKIYEYHPDDDGWYGICRHTKMIFPKQTFMYTDSGFHRGRTILDPESNFDTDECYWRSLFTNPNIEDKILDINISYIHNHFKSKEIWLKNTQKKLQARLGDNWNDIEYLISYTGPSIHLKNRYLLYIYSNHNQWHNVKKIVFLGKDI